MNLAMDHLQTVTVWLCLCRAVGIAIILCFAGVALITQPGFLGFPDGGRHISTLGVCFALFQVIGFSEHAGSLCASSSVFVTSALHINTTQMHTSDFCCVPPLSYLIHGARGSRQRG